MLSRLEATGGDELRFFIFRNERMLTTSGWYELSAMVFPFDAKMQAAIHRAY